MMKTQQTVIGLQAILLSLVYKLYYYDFPSKEPMASPLPDMSGSVTLKSDTLLQSFHFVTHDKAKKTGGFV